MSVTNPIMARFANEATLVAPESRAWFESCVHEAASMMIRIESATDAPRMDSDGFWFAPDDWRAAYRPYVVKDGILHIPVKGVLLNDFGYALGSWATGYQYIWRAFERGQRDPEVRGIALVCDTPGGMVAGNFELVDRIHGYPDRKPVRGYAYEAAYSAGYSIISSADTVNVSRTGGVGSIGVVTSHLDVSKAMDRDGYVLTFIYAGKHKVDGNPYATLPDDVKARIQARIDNLYSIFVSTVARNRSMDEGAVRATEALTFSADDALVAGLADTIGPFDDALADFAASFDPSTGEEDMADFTQAQLDQAVADAVASTTQSVTASVTAAAATAERTRISAILASDEGKVRPKAALSLAMKSNMDLETATAVLADMAVEAAVTETATTPTAGAPKGMLNAAMDNSPNPNLNADGGENEPDDDDLAIAQSFPGRRKAA